MRKKQQRSALRPGLLSRPENSHAYLVLCRGKFASELSLQLHEIILTLASLQWQRVFWTWCSISQLSNVNYQPTTCQTLTIKMSLTKISSLQNEQWNVLSEAYRTVSVLSCLRLYCRVPLLCLIRAAVKSNFVDNVADLKQCFALTSPVSAEWWHWIYGSIPP